MARRLRTTLICLSAALALAGCETQLYDNLNEGEANDIVAALLDADIPAAKKPGTEGSFRVMVEEEHFARAVEVLKDHGLPARRYDDLGQVFGKDAMFSTPTEEKARYLHAMQEELAHTVASIDGVLAARVHLVLPENDQLGRPMQKPSAAVFVKYLDDERHDPGSHRNEIRRLIGAAIPGLEEDRIVVSFFPASVPTARTAPTGPAWTMVLGMRVDADSATRLRRGLAATGALVILSAGAALWFGLRRRRRAGAAAPDSEPMASSGAGSGS